ncbi:serine/threonine protein kinase [Nonomuraea fuscirosea]|uniref:serine/threonine-protein kinase n=1 Tax=Nonomuraea fuscirosea TaxID=1291556 RepID=UPI002DD96A8C|nr:serine/threonine-protein kinase [Nonomuraea fuscirosea]WSA58078.1 serine/threonine protein kinase [Nonomuraea fuscirosea]
MAQPLTPDDPASLGGFRLSGRLGEGGQGVVYLAHSGDGEPVAIKLLNTGDRETRARLARELEALEGVASFCTARVLDVSTDGPRPFVVSEYVDGPSLADRVRERGPLRGGDLERLVVGTATALAAIHAAGIVHRDFKPANVLLGPDGPRVVDFGIARAEGAATMTSGLIGTPAYLAPEQISGVPASPASDVFAWATSMVYAASGTSPFGADTVPAVLHRVLHAEPDLSPLPARLREVIGSCLAKDPALRPSARDLMMSLVGPGTITPGTIAPGTAAPGTAAPGTAAPGTVPPGIVTPGTAVGPGSVQAHPHHPDPPPAAFQGQRTGPRDGGPTGPQGGGPTGTGPQDGGPTGPRSPAETTAGTSRRPPGRNVLIGVVVAMIALGVAGGTVLMLNPPSGTRAERTPPATSTTDTSPSPTDSRTATEEETTPEPAPSETASPTASDTPTDSGESETPTADPDLKIPAAFEGDWRGHTTSTNPMSPGGADNEVDLREGESTAGWAEKGASADCKGTITLTKVEQTRLTFSLGANEGGCVPGTITLDRDGDALTYTWRDVPGLGLVTQTGKLEKN